MSARHRLAFPSRNSWFKQFRGTVPHPRRSSASKARLPTLYSAVTTAHGIFILSIPLAKNAPIRPRWRYQRAHCCSDVAHKIQLRLITRLKNEREFIQTTYLGGENEGRFGDGRKSRCSCYVRVSQDMMQDRCCQGRMRCICGLIH